MYFKSFIRGVRISMYLLIRVIIIIVFRVRISILLRRIVVSIGWVNCRGKFVIWKFFEVIL